MASSTSPRIAVVVVGMHRSGTSAVTRALSLAGLELPKDVGKKLWESRAVIMLDNQVLSRFRMRWHSLGLIAPERLVDEDLADLRAEAVSLLKTIYGPSQHIVVKEPRMARLIPFWEKVFAEFGAEPRYVLPLRSPRDVASSLAARNEMPLAMALDLWTDHVVAGERDTRGKPRTFVNYDDFLRDKSVEVARVLDALGVPVGPIDAERRAAIDAFVSEESRHHKADDDLFELGAASAVAATLYARLADGRPADPGANGLVARLAAVAALPAVRPPVKKPVVKKPRPVITGPQRKKAGAAAVGKPAPVRRPPPTAQPAAPAKPDGVAEAKAARRKARREAAPKPLAARLAKRLRRLFRPKKG